MKKNRKILPLALLFLMASLVVALSFVWPDMGLPLNFILVGALIAYLLFRKKNEAPVEENELTALKLQYKKITKDLLIKETTAKELDQKSYNLYILYSASKALSSILDFQELLSLALDMVIEVMGVESGLFLLANEDADELAYGRGKGPAFQDKPKISLRIGDGLAEWVLKAGDPILVASLAEDSPFRKAFPDGYENLVSMGAVLVVPMLHKHRLVGLVALGSRYSNEPFSPNDLELISTLTPLISNAISNVHLYEMAILDANTKLFVVRYFRQRIKEEIKRAKRYYKPMSLIMMDLDDFKHVNDQHGHQQGDSVLQDIGMIIRRCCRQDVDIAARYGGEEFVVLLPDTELEGAVRVAERIRGAVSVHGFLDSTLHCTISGGVATYPTDALHFGDLIEKADMALYQAKRSGKNRICVNSSTSQPASEASSEAS
ncbi:MAG: sensor domain-containing diguanylate cyclase [Armatimonadetes bacterium]|nr:sensor domain-containing diguanylate cyclase [Armatimonadota bacterium]